MLIYTKLWLLLEKRGMKRTDLKEIMSSATLAKLGKNEPVSSTVIAKICDFLNCQPNDIMENVTKENIGRLTALGVDYISSGALTHSAPILDISMKNLHAIN